MKNLVVLTVLAELASCKPTLPAPTAPKISYGTAMADVARRFELAGKALQANRLELARYEVGELDEVFTGTLPAAELPREGHPEVLKSLAPAFAAQVLPSLKTALQGSDASAQTTAFERTAAACNACHQASGHGFIVVPSRPGQSVPDTTPLKP